MSPKELVLDCLDKVLALRKGGAMVVDQVKDEGQQQELDKITAILREILGREDERKK